MVSIIIPAHNEEKFIKNVVKLFQKSNIVDDIIVVDNNSEDKTSSIAEKCGAKVVFCEQKGKGYAMEMGLKYAKNDIIMYADGDICNYSKNLVELMTDPIINGEAEFVKSEFNRTGGRVTELLAKPLLDILFPDMYKFSQPLSGVIAGKKADFLNLTFEKDYGVDIGILLDMINNNVKTMEVCIGNVTNDSQKLDSLSVMAKQISKAIFKRANIKVEENN